MERYRKYMLTINNPADHDMMHEHIIKLITKHKTAYWALCDETGSQGTYHTHVYVRYVNAIAMTSIIELFNHKAHVDVAMGSSTDCRSYLLKAAPHHNKDSSGNYDYTDSRGVHHHGVNHGETFEESGPCPIESPGKRNDLIALYSLIKEGYTNAQIIEELGDIAIRYNMRLDKLRHDHLVDRYRAERRLDLKVHYIYGKTGTGKTRGVLDAEGDSDCFRVTDYAHPFDSYNLERVLIFEEFRSQLPIGDMLNYLDVYPVELPARYSNRCACYRTVYIISNWPFEHQYSGVQEDLNNQPTYQAFVRRINGLIRVYYDNDKYDEYRNIDTYLNRSDSAFMPLTGHEQLPFD